MKYLIRTFFISLIACSTIIFCSFGSCEDPENSEQGVRTTFKVQGLACSSCENKLKGELMKNQLIHSATPNAQAGTCEVQHDKSLSVQAIKDIINKTNFQVVE